MRRRRRLLIGAGVALLYGVVHRLGRTFGSSSAERGARLPGDELVTEPELLTDHAVTIAAPPEQIWPWLNQVGWHRGGWYTPSWVDRLLFPANWPSADVLLPDTHPLSVGDWIPDGPTDARCGFVVEQVDATRHLVLRSITHLPLAWRDAGVAAVDWTWVFVLTPVDDGLRTRLHLRVRGHLEPWWARIGYSLLLVPADLVMARSMLRGIRTRSERPRNEDLRTW